MSRLLERWPLLEGALIVLVSAWALGFQATLPGRLPTEADYQAVAQVLAQEARPGDVVQLFPWWTERARLYLPEGTPVVGYLGGDGDPLELHPRIWVLGQPDLPRSDAQDFLSRFGPGRTSLGPARRFGHLTLELFTNGRHRAPRWDARTALPQARVAVEGPAGAAACPQEGGAFRCRHVAVGVEWHELKFQPRRCLRFNPPGGPARLVAEFTGLPAAPSLLLAGGYIWEHAPRVGDVTGTQVVVEVNGAPVGTLSLPPGTDGLQRLELPGVPEGATVRLSSQADNPTARELCLELYALEAARP